LEADSDEDQARCDMYAEQIQDYFTKFTRWWAWLWLKLGTEEERDKYYESDLKPAFEEFGELYSELLQNNNSGFLVGQRVTWLDVFVAHFVDYMPMTTKNPDLFAKFPLIQQHYKKVFALPTIAEYVKKRADYPF
ncbi:CBN-GST-36 protein, partial [Aphelenchoides avenae]